MKEFQRSEFLQKHIVDLRVVCPSRQKSCHMSSERIGTLHKWTDKNLNNSFEEWILKNNTSYKDALFSKYFTKIYRVFNFRTEELRTSRNWRQLTEGRDLALLAQLAPSARALRVSLTGVQIAELREPSRLDRSRDSHRHTILRGTLTRDSVCRDFRITKRTITPTRLAQNSGPGLAVSRHS